MKQVYATMAIFLLLMACGKNDQQVATSNSICFSGLVQAEDVRASAGMGWVISRAYDTGNPFVVNNLGLEFRQHDLAVNICIEETSEKISCNCSNNGNSVYRIVSISRR